VRTSKTSAATTRSRTHRTNSPSGSPSPERRVERHRHPARERQDFASGRQLDRVRTRKFPFVRDLRQEVVKDALSFSYGGCVSKCRSFGAMEWDANVRGRRASAARDSTGGLRPCHP
jgi:hypothetical protein